MTDYLEMWVVYDHPADYPDRWVARCFHYDQLTDKIRTALSLQALRVQLPDGLHRQERDSSDDPAIYEVWY